jgi:hypothetical protein
MLLAEALRSFVAPCHHNLIPNRRRRTIFHIETHNVLLANGVPAESYRDDGNRWLFQTPDQGGHLPPQPPCAPVLTAGAVADAIWPWQQHSQSPALLPNPPRDRRALRAPARPRGAHCHRRRHYRCP